MLVIKLIFINSENRVRSKSILSTTSGPRHEHYQFIFLYTSLDGKKNQFTANVTNVVGATTRKKSKTPTSMRSALQPSVPPNLIEQKLFLDLKHETAPEQQYANKTLQVLHSPAPVSKTAKARIRTGLGFEANFETGK